MSQISKGSNENSAIEPNSGSSSESSASSRGSCYTSGNSTGSARGNSGSTATGSSNSNSTRSSQRTSSNVIADNSENDGHSSSQSLVTTTEQTCDNRTVAISCPSKVADDKPHPYDEDSGHSSRAPKCASTLPRFQTKPSELEKQQNQDTQNESSQVLTKPGQFSASEKQSKSATNPSSPYSIIHHPTLANEEIREADEEEDDDEKRPQETSRLASKPMPSPSPSVLLIESKNEKYATTSSSNTRSEPISGLRRTHFSKSASGGRLVNRHLGGNICDCLAQNCDEKEHSNRKHFIENYCTSRTTKLPPLNSMLTFNINTPLTRLNECDAITRRLLSSPIRASNVTENPCRHAQISEVGNSRRASLGTSALSDQVFLYSANQFDSLESPGNNADESDEEVVDQDNQQAAGRSSIDDANFKGGDDVKLKQSQGRSLSVCDEETFKPRFRNTGPNHFSSLNRAISLACESGTSKRLLTIIPLFGCDIETLKQFGKLGLILPPSIDSAVDYLLYNGLNAVGIFRKSGVKSRILTLRQRFETNQDVKIDELNKNNEFSIYDVADLVKMWFRELKPGPLMTKELILIISNFFQKGMTSVPDHECGTSSQQDSLSLLNKDSLGEERQSEPCLKTRVESVISPTHRALFSKALRLLARISSQSGTNQMTSQNLAICLTPSLCASESDQTSIMTAQKALEYCIDNYRILF